MRKRKVVSGITLTLLLIGMLTLAFDIQPVESDPTTIIVPDEHEKIQWAIGNATDGDTIFVRAGTYYENVVVNKSVSLIGENRYTTIVDGNGSTVEVFAITKSNVKVSNFTITNATAGVRFKSEAKNNTLSNCIIDCVGLHGSIGISIQNKSAANRLINNTVKRANMGIRINAREGGSNILRGNSIVDRVQAPRGMGFGIYPRYGESIQDFTNDI